MGREFVETEETRAFERGKRASFRAACIIITSADHKREALIDEQIVPAALTQGFDEVLVVGEHHEGHGYRYLHVPSLTRTTLDALVKRDVGTLATNADVLFYVTDDHKPRVGNMNWLWPNQGWDVMIPLRWTERNGTRIPLNNGESERYCGGHGGVYRRWLIEALPWCCLPHHANWDLLGSRAQQAMGAKFTQAAGIEVWDVEGGEPWR